MRNTCGGTQACAGQNRSIPDRVAGALAYLFVIPAILFLLRDPFRKNRFIRFHAWQSILVAAATLVVFAVLFTIMGKVLVIFASFIVVGRLVHLVARVDGESVARGDVPTAVDWQTGHAAGWSGLILT